MASQAPWPLMPTKSTEMRLEHFAEEVYIADSSTILYKFIDAMCGDSGAGSLKKEIFIQRLSGALQGIYGSDLDYIFGNVHFLSRNTDEAYTYNTMTDMLTSDQWDEVWVKDQWYRNRIKEYFTACSMGGTADGIRTAVHAAISVDCQIMENWRYIDNFGLGNNVGRAPVSSRNEFTVVPYKASLHPKETRTLRQMLDKITPQDTIVTIDTQGLTVASPVKIQSATCDSSYYEVQKMVVPTPILGRIPEPETLAIDLIPSELWLLYSKNAQLAPYAQFNITQEYGYYYLVSGGTRSPIDSVEYGTLRDDGSIKAEVPYEQYEESGQYTAWTDYDTADSPDNFPGGKFGLHPETAPALNADQTPYQFSYASQAAYVTERKGEIIAMGGYADDARYRLPIQKAAVSKRTYTADLAIAYTAPARDSTVTSSWTSRKPRQVKNELRDESAFIRS